MTSDCVPTFVIPLSEVEVDEGDAAIIGSGALGQVRRGRYGDHHVALKGLHLLRTDAASVAAFGGALNPDERVAFLQKFMQECTLLQSFEHANIVPFFGVVCDETPAMEPLYLAMQFVPSGTLQDLIHGERHRALRSDEGFLPLMTQAVALLGLFSALEYLATRNLIHRDIKPANILAVIEEGSTILTKVLVADFGEAKQLTRSMSRVSAAGTPVYMAPESTSLMHRPCCSSLDLHHCFNLGLNSPSVRDAQWPKRTRPRRPRPMCSALASLPWS
jgi:serine/threonine protein kinase